MELARNQIASKRLLLDDAITAITSVYFFFSCISSVCSNAKTHNSEGGDTPSTVTEEEVYPSISYFIVYTPNDDCDENTFFSALHNQDVEPCIQPIRVRSKTGSSNMETAARQLFQTVKEHDNASITKMLYNSNVYCYENVSDTDDDDEDEHEDAFTPIHFPTLPCVFRVVHDEGYSDAIESAIERLQSDGLVVETALCGSQRNEVPSLSQSNDVTRTIRQIERVMEICKHALYRSAIYAIPDNAKMTYVRMMDVGTYLNKLLANDALNNALVRNFQAVEKILSHPACEIVQQIEFDFNLIEVSNGVCFSINSRRFIPNAIPSTKIGKLSPRAFVPYDSSTPPQPGYFEQGILNSFGELEQRVNFLNKFYQCLVAFKMPQKTRKLVLVGPRDSGKTSWCYVFHRIIPPHCIASVTSEGQFSAAMITDTTQLIVIDEWSTNRMRSDLAKTILQGGWMVTSVKHGLPRCVMNHSPFYITTNTLPDFRDENENVRRRIQVFETSSLPNVISGIDSWIYDHAMDCVAWAAQEIDNHHDLVSKEELWYETDVSSVVTSQSGKTLWKRNEVTNITMADLEPVNPSNVQQASEDTIHPGFIAELRYRRLARKRKMKRYVLSSDSSTDENETIPSSHLVFDTDSSDPNGDGSTASKNKMNEEGELNETATSPDENDAIPQDYEQPNNSQPANSPVEVERPVLGNAHNIDPVDVQPSNVANADNIAPVEPPNVANDDNMNQAAEEDILTSPNDEPPVTHEQNEPQQGPSNVDDDEQYNMFQRISTPSAGWVLNSREYFDRVANLIHWNMNGDVKKAHVHTFLQRRDNANSKRTHSDRQFWIKADPDIDAWMLATGNVREVFDLNSFVERHNNILPALQHLRRNMNVRVLESRCPVKKALDNPHGTAEEVNQQEIPSQTYWTTFKSWFSK